MGLPRMGIKAKLKTKWPWAAVIYRWLLNQWEGAWSPIHVGRSVFFVQSLSEPDVLKNSGKTETSLRIDRMQSLDELKGFAKGDVFWGKHFASLAASHVFGPHTIVLAGNIGGRLVGMLCLAVGSGASLAPPLPKGYDLGRRPYLYGFLVHPDLRGRGVGSRMQKIMNDWMIKNNINTFARMVWDRNAAAMSLALSDGAVACGSVIHLRLVGWNSYWYLGDGWKG